MNLAIFFSRCCCCCCGAIQIEITGSFSKTIKDIKLAILRLYSLIVTNRNNDVRDKSPSWDATRRLTRIGLKNHHHPFPMLSYMYKWSYLHFTWTVCNSSNRSRRRSSIHYYYVINCHFPLNQRFVAIIFLSFFHSFIIIESVSQSAIIVLLYANWNHTWKCRFRFYYII